MNNPNKPMNTTASITAGLLLALAIGAQGATIITYQEDFTTPSGNETLADNGWNGNYSDNATAYPNSTDSGTAPVFSGPGDFLFINTTDAPVFVWTDGLTAGSASVFDSVQFSLNNDDASENVRITLQIAGAWFVTDSTYNGSDINAILSTSGSAWSSLSFDSGTSMEIGSTVALPTTGQITGVGVYDVERSDSIRFDNLTIHTIPEPSGAMLLGAAGFLILLRRRR